MVEIELWQIGRKMWNNVLMVDNTVDIGNAIVNVSCQVRIADSGGSEVMDFHIDIIEHSLKFHSRNHRQSTSQTVPSRHHSRIGVLIEQVLHLVVDRCLDCSVICEKTSMYFAAQTVQIWHFLEIEVLYPVLDVG